MQRARLVLCTPLLSALALAAPAAAASSKPAARATATVTDVQPASGLIVPFAEATLRKGKKGQILRIDVSTHFNAGGGTSVSGGITSVAVNDYYVTLPYPTSISCSAPSYPLCAVNFTLWVDLDFPDEGPAEAYIGQPLHVQVEGAISFGGAVGTASTKLLVEMIKK